VSLREAIEKAEEAGVDLVEISPNAEPPVCRIMDYGKFLYEKVSLLRNRRRSKKLSRLRKLNSVLVPTMAIIR
jgi:translation initiation factor IF-3